MAEETVHVLRHQLASKGNAWPFSQSQNLRLLRVANEDYTVFLELVAGGAEAFVSNVGVEVEGFEIHAALDAMGRLVGFIVPDASQALPEPYSLQ